MVKKCRDLDELLFYTECLAMLTAWTRSKSALRGPPPTFSTGRPVILDEMAQRSDQLSQLARVVQRRARDVFVREQRIIQPIQELLERAKALLGCAGTHRIRSVSVEHLVVRCDSIGF